MRLMKIDPRALIVNPDPTRLTKSTPQSDALLLASIKAVGIIQPPIVTPQSGRGNGLVIQIGRRRVDIFSQQKKLCAVPGGYALSTKARD